MKATVLSVLAIRRRPPAAVAACARPVQVVNGRALCLDEAPSKVVQAAVGSQHAAAAPEGQAKVLALRK